MRITVKNSQLGPDTIQVLNKMIEYPISASSAFKLSRIIKHISSIVEDKVLMEKRILDRWMVKNEDGSPVRPVDNENNEISDAIKISDINKFNNEMNDLMSIDNELPYDQINFDDLKLETATIKDLIKVDFLFT